MPEGISAVPQSAALAPLHAEAHPAAPPTSSTAPSATETAHPSPSLADKFFQGAGVNATTEQKPKNSSPAPETGQAKPPTEAQKNTTRNSKTETQPTPDRQPDPDASDYYKVLDVDPKATKDELKSAFREAAMKYHPDKNKSPEANEQFLRINEAYTVLSDDVKRGRYDAQLKACENLSDSDLNRAATTADALYNIAGDGKIGSYLQTEMQNRLGISPETATPQQIAGLLPDLAAPLAEQLARPESGMSFLIPLTPEDIQVIRAVDTAYKSKNPEAMLGLEIALQMLLLLMMMINILQKVAAHEDWSESFDVLARQAGATGNMAEVLKSMVKLRRSKEEKPAPKEKPEQNQVTPLPQIPTAAESQLPPETASETLQLPEYTVTHSETPIVYPDNPSLNIRGEAVSIPAAIPITESPLMEQAQNAAIPAPPLFTNVPAPIPTPV